MLRRSASRSRAGCSSRRSMPRMHTVIRGRRRATSQEGAPGDILSFSDDRWDVGISERLSTGMVLSARWTNARSRSTLGTAVEPLTYRSALDARNEAAAVARVLARPHDSAPRGSASDARVGARTPAAQRRRDRRRRAHRGRVLGRRARAVQLRLAAPIANARRRAARADEAPDRCGRDAAVGLDLRRVDARATPAAVLQAQQTVEAAWDQLRGVMHLPREDWAKPILPVDVPKFERRDRIRRAGAARRR